jgi:hypothetical protein
MTDARLGGLGREALIAEAGQLRAGGLVREALVAGVGLSATVTSHAAASGTPTALFAGVILSASIKTTNSSSAAGPFSLHIDIGGRVGATSSLRAGVSSTLVLGGRITAQSKAELVPLGLQGLQCMINATSDAEMFAIVATTRTRQNSVTINAS